MNGILLVDKPKGWTSFDVVKKVRSVIQQETDQKIKVGHSGTLDPFATGLLVLLISKATKMQQKFMQLNKDYQATAILGKKSTTGDPEGEITEVSVNEIPASEEVARIEKKFLGKQMQTPHKFSAIKLKGKRAYELARAGKEVKMEPREITVSKLEIKHYEWPELEFVSQVSSGTYIRTLVEDIGDFLGTGAYTHELRRTAVGNFNVDEAVTEIKDVSYDILKTHLIPLESTGRL